MQPSQALHGGIHGLLAALLDALCDRWLIGPAAHHMVGEQRGSPSARPTQAIWRGIEHRRRRRYRTVATAACPVSRVQQPIAALHDQERPFNDCCIKNPQLLDAKVDGRALDVRLVTTSSRLFGNLKRRHAWLCIRCHSVRRPMSERSWIKRRPSSRIIHSSGCMSILCCFGTWCMPACRGCTHGTHLTARCMQ